jgi:hypothetical protein
MPRTNPQRVTTCQGVSRPGLRCGRAMTCERKALPFPCGASRPQWLGQACGRQGEEAHGGNRDMACRALRVPARCVIAASLSTST